MAGWRYPRRNRIKDPILQDVVLSLENWFNKPSFNRIVLTNPGGSTWNATTQRREPALQVEFDAESILDTPPGSITTTEIADNAISTPKLQANVVVASKLAAISLEVGKYIRSTTYTPGSAGWAIDAAGSAEFSDVVVRGRYEAIGTSSRQMILRADGVITGGPEMILYTGSVQESSPGAVHTGRVDNTPAGNYEFYTIVESPSTATSNKAYLYLRALKDPSNNNYNTITLAATNIGVYGDTDVRMRHASTQTGFFANSTLAGIYKDTASTSTLPTLFIDTSSSKVRGSTSGGGLTLGPAQATLWGADNDNTKNYIDVTSTSASMVATTGGSDSARIRVLETAGAKTADVTVNNGSNDYQLQISESAIDLIAGTGGGINMDSGGTTIYYDYGDTNDPHVDLTSTGVIMRSNAGSSDTSWLYANNSSGAYYAEMAVISGASLSRTITVDESTIYAYRSDITGNKFGIPAVLGQGAAVSGSPSLSTDQWFIQSGNATVTTSNPGGTATITYPVAFGKLLTVMVCGQLSDQITINAYGGASTFDIIARTSAGVIRAGVTLTVPWIAIGTK